MADTLILVFHSDLNGSKANAALAARAATLADVEVVDMQALYPHHTVDADREVARLLAAKRVVLQFPVQWYSTPPLLRTWQDVVLTRMIYLAYEAEGQRLAGIPMLIAATAGNAPDAYSAEGINRFPLEELLRPLEATAHRCGMIWATPFLLYRANKLDADAVARACDCYAERLNAWADQPPASGPVPQCEERKTTITR